MVLYRPGGNEEFFPNKPVRVALHEHCDYLPLPRRDSILFYNLLRQLQGGSDFLLENELHAGGQQDASDDQERKDLDEWVAVERGRSKSLLANSLENH